MPFQQISLDQSIYNKPKKSPVSQALRPQEQKSGTRSLSDINAPNSSVERMKAEWAASDKAKKAERDMQMQKLQEVGIQTVQQAQQQQQQVQQQQAQVKQQVESNPEAAAKEMYELMKTLPDEAKTQLLQQIFTPTSTGGFIEAGGVRKDMPDKYNPIANVFLEKGWAMFDPKGNVNLSEPEPVTEKGTYTMNANGDVLNTATGNVAINKNDIPEGIASSDLLDVIKEARAYVTGLADPSMIEGLTPEGRAQFYASADPKFKSQVAYILAFTYGIEPKEATRMANLIPKQTDLFPTAGGGTTTDPTIVSDLKKLFDENPSETNNRKAYEDKYGAENVAAALGEVKVTKETPKKEPYKPALPLSNLKTEDIIANLKRGLANAKDIPPSKWTELNKSIDEWLKKITSKKVFK